jgi:hypothetical protein
VQDDLTIGQSVLHVQGGSPVIGHGLEGVFRPNEAAIRITGNATAFLKRNAVGPPANPSLIRRWTAV